MKNLRQIKEIQANTKASVWITIELYTLRILLTRSGSDSFSFVSHRLPLTRPVELSGSLAIWYFFDIYKYWALCMLAFMICTKQPQ